MRQRPTVYRQPLGGICRLLAPRARLHSGTTLPETAMNALIPTGLAILAATTTIAAAPTIAAACGMRVIQSDTNFPERSQLRGHKGTVLINVTLDGSGRATGAEVERSSGHAVLDRAATRSVLDHWRFDVSHCDHAWPAVHQVAVEYRNEEYQ
jgi:TonB family protein